jgi:hypothetical protein
MQNFYDQDLTQLSRVGNRAAAEFSSGKKRFPSVMRGFLAKDLASTAPQLYDQSSQASHRVERSTWRLSGRTR